ncbi:ABC transporter permease subunit [Cytobacillus suaedae]|nr:ABC transporter permease subunit [Cytobacillus suaedae]
MRKFSFLAGVTILTLIILIAFIGPYTPFIDSELKEKKYEFLEDDTIIVPPYPPSKEYLLGSDSRGVDLLSRLVMGARETMIIIFSIVIIRMLLGVILGFGAAYSRLIQAFLTIWNQLFSYIPPIFLIAMIIGIPFFLVSPNRPFWFIFILAILEVGRVGDTIHKLVVSITQTNYYEAGIVVGNSPLGLSKKYLLPNLSPQLVTIVVNELGRVLFLIAQLGVIGIFINVVFEPGEFGGFKIVNGSESWPNLLDNIQRDIYSHQIVPFSGILVISLTVLSFYVVGNGIIRKLSKR